MIIKKVKVPKNKQEEEDKTKQSHNLANNQAVKTNIPEGPRQERRRGDRRRGYRRVDDRTLISRAHEEANAIREVASKDGFEYGLEKSQEEIQNLSKVITDLLDAKEKTMLMVTNDIAKIAIKVAEKIIKKEVSLDNEIVLNITSETIKEMGKGHQNIVIKVNPADSSLIRSKLPELYPYGDSKTNIVVLEEQSIEWGSCIVETNTGIVDASFGTQLIILQKAFELGI